MASPAKPITKPLQLNPGKPCMQPKRFVSQREKGHFEKFRFAQNNPGEFALRQKWIIPLGMRRHNLRFLQGVGHKDIEQECFIVLMESARTWLPFKGAFSTHAVENMKKCKRIIEETHCNAHFPQDVKTNINAYRIWKRHNPDAGIEKFALYMEISLGKAMEIEQDAQMHKNARIPANGNALFYGEKASFPRNGNENSTPYIPVSRVKRQWEHFQNPYSTVERESLSALISKALSSLDSVERSLMEATFVLNGVQSKSLTEMMEEYGISREKAKQLFNGAMRKVRNELERMGLANYLQE